VSTLKCVVDTRCHVGEGPLWHPGEAALYWLDITRGAIYRFHPRSGVWNRPYSGEPVAGMTCQADGSLLLFTLRGAVKRWSRGEETTLLELPEERDAGFNDVIADPEGRVFAGTFATSERAGRLYRLDVGGAAHRVLAGVRGSNGLGFTEDAASLLYADSEEGTVTRFAYDRATGSLAGGQLFARFDRSAGVPDGLTVDAQGYVWVALWDGGCVLRLDPDGRVAERLELPARKVSSLTFGGEDYRDLYVTTAGGDDREGEGEGAGALFRIRGPHQGVPDYPSRLFLQGTSP